MDTKTEKQVVEPPVTYAPDYIKQMSREELEALSIELTTYALDVFCLISHWYMVHYHDPKSFSEETRSEARLDLLKASGSSLLDSIKK